MCNGKHKQAKRDKCRMQGNRDINGNNVNERVRNVTADISELTGEQQFSQEMNRI